MSFDPASYTSGSTGITLGSRIEIFPSQPLPELNTAGGNAYAARFKTDAASDLYAVVCMSNLPPRIEAAAILRAIDHPSIVRLIESGVVTWPDGVRGYALVYQRPLAPRMMASIDETRPPLGEDAINHHFIMPMIGALTALMNAGIAHNALRPTNIFWRIGNAAPPQIGECLSAPAGLGQPVLFETIERAQTMPLGRGMGTHADDCYAFGMSLALLVLGRNPLQGLDDAAIIDAKMQRGSFGAVIGAQRLSTTHIEILRGLLSDDDRQRWSAADLDQWLSGRRMTPKSSDAGRRAARHFTFAGKEFWQVGPLAAAMAANVGEAARMIESEALDKWLRRALNDIDRAGDVEATIRELKQSGKTAHYEDQLVARVCIALDPNGPIRYRGVAAMPAGIGALLADSVVNGTLTAPLAEMIASRLAGLWIEMKKDGKADDIAMIQLFERMKGLIEKTGFGQGIERVTYEINPGLPCLSPMLRSQYVNTPKALLAAMERMAGAGGRPRDPIDRHIAAFLIVRDKRSETLFDAMSEAEGSARRGIALLTLFAELQYRHGPESAPQMAQWLMPLVEPATRRFLGKALRERLQKQIKEAVAVGDLNALLRLIDDPRRIERDRQDFMAARMLHLNIQKEIAGLESKLQNRDSVVRGAGKPMAASISSFLAIILICAAILRAFFQFLLQ